jgi:ABC-type uncharacterized transport system substrate-binding protein
MKLSWILDFRFSIGRRKCVNAVSSKRMCASYSAIAFALAFAFDGVEAHAQQTGKVFRIGFLDPSTASGMAVLVDAFRDALNKLGWIEGKNIKIEYRFAEQKLDRVHELAADLVRQKVDLIVVSGTPVAIAAKKETGTIPIVVAAAGDPVAAKLVASLAQPGGNLTGLSALAVELNTKRLEILSDTVSNLSRVGVLRPPGESLGRELQLKDLRKAAAALKLHLEEIETQLSAKGVESVPDRETETGPWNHDNQRDQPFYRAKANYRARRQISLSGYLLSKGVCHRRGPHVVWRRL